MIFRRIIIAVVGWVASVAAPAYADQLPTIGHHNIPDFAAFSTATSLVGAGPEDIVLLSGEHVIGKAAPDDGTRAALLAIAESLEAMEPPTGDAAVVLNAASAEIRALAEALGVPEVGDVTVRAIGVHGKLTVRGTLRVKDLIVYADGWLDLQPGAEIIIRDIPLDTDADPEQYGTGINVLGKLTASGTPKTSWTRAVAGLTAGQADVDVQDATGWLPGDTLVISRTKQSPVASPEGLAGTEFRKVAVVAGNRITLDAPLTDDHAPVTLDGKILATAYVGNLTRDVTVRSENPAGVRGHTLVTDHAFCDVRYAAFLGLTRTTVADLDNTEFDADGNVTHLGANQKARYAVHLHHHHGPHLADFHFRFIGCAIDGLENWETAKWGASVHVTHFGLMEDVVCVRFGGAGIMTEDGPEFGNTFRHCLAGHIAKGPEKPISSEDTGRVSAAFWFRGQANIVDDCHAFGALTGHAFAGYRLSRKGGGGDLGSLRPTKWGQHPTVPFIIAEHKVLFSGEALGCSIGFETWDIGSYGGMLFDMPQSEIRLKAFNCARFGVWLYRTHRLSFIDATLVNSNPGQKTRAWSMGTAYGTRGLEIIGGVTAGYMWGVDPPHRPLTNQINDTGLVQFQEAGLMKLSDQLVSGGAELPRVRVKRHRLVNQVNFLHDLATGGVMQRRYELEDCTFEHPPQAGGVAQTDVRIGVVPAGTTYVINGVELGTGEHELP